MIRLLLILIFSTSTFVNGQYSTVTDFANTITTQELKEHLYVYASDYFGGRETGTKGQKIAVDFLRAYYIRQNIPPALGTELYFQKMKLRIKGTSVDTENVIAIIEGTQFPEEYVFVSAHLDHIGTHNGVINNGADDDGSGTVAIMEIAEAFKLASINGKGPKRSVVFLHVSGEENGLLGSKYYVENPLYPLSQTVANLNIDMIGRLDPKRTDKDPNYIYLIGADKLSQELHDISEATNERFTKLKLDYTFNEEDDPNRFYYRSDHYNFAKNNIPVIFYFNGTHADYHQPTDTVEKIDFPLLKKRTQLIFHTLWELANRSKRIKLNL